MQCTQFANRFKVDQAETEILRSEKLKNTFCSQTQPRALSGPPWFFTVIYLGIQIQIRKHQIQSRMCRDFFWQLTRFVRMVVSFDKYSIKVLMSTSRCSGRESSKDKLVVEVVRGQRTVYIAGIVYRYYTVTSSTSREVVTVCRRC